MKEYYKNKNGVLYLGDCKEVISQMVNDSSFEKVNLVFTSPPYAERRIKSYGGIPEENYTSWFLPIGALIKSILKDDGSFFLNIKPHTNKGERSLYVFELVLALKKEIGFLFVDEFCWKKNPFPGMLKGRFKNSFEPIYHFSKISPNNIIFNPLACGTSIKEESIARSYRKQCGPPKNGSGMTGMNTTNIRNLKLARPSNLVDINNVSNQFSNKKKHPATFPEGLSDFFVKSFSNERDIVLDPFGGSGTVALSAERLNRRWILIEKEEKYCDLIVERLIEKKIER